MESPPVVMLAAACMYTNMFTLYLLVVEFFFMVILYTLLAKSKTIIYNCDGKNTIALALIHHTSTNYTYAIGVTIVD